MTEQRCGAIVALSQGETKTLVPDSQDELWLYAESGRSVDGGDHWATLPALPTAGGYLAPDDRRSGVSSG